MAARITQPKSQAVGEWIPVTDALPEEGERVISFGPPPYDRRRVKTVFDARKDGKWLSGNLISHWLRLPPLPEWKAGE